MKRFHFYRLFWIGLALINILFLTGRLVLATPPQKVEKKVEKKTGEKPAPKTAALKAVSRFQESLTLLDEAGRLVQPVSLAQARQWRQALHADNLTTTQRSGLHLWLGEWELAQNQQPERALAHFRLAQNSVRRSDAVYGLAAYDTALTLLQDGAYAKAAPAFQRLFLLKTALKGYNRRTAALWYRHACACEGYHAANLQRGIPEPTRLDPLCGPAALAECFRAHGLPSNKATLKSACRMTGFGSTLEDLARAAAKCGMSAYPVSADEAGLRALPKPLVAHVEGDHFVALVRADEKGVSYLCSDCGAWPGGRINLTWAQWRAMNPGVYLAVVPKNSVEDAALSQLASTPPQTAPGLRFAATGRLPRLSPQVLAAQRMLLTLLKLHVVAYDQPNNTYCGYRPDSPHCPPAVSCPDDCGAGGGGGGGSSAGDPVNLATGEEEYQPSSDLFVYNPVGPSVSWSRIYNSLRSHGNYYEFDDYGTGWSHSYNVRLYVSGQQVHLVMPNGSQYVFNAAYIPSAAAPSVTCSCVTSGVPLLVNWNYSGGVNSFSVLQSDRTQWIFTDQIKSLDSPPCYSLSRIVNRTGQGINFVYDGYGPASQANSAGFPLLAAITDDNEQPLLTIARSRDGKANITSMADRYGRGVSYQFLKFNNTNTPPAYPQSEQELTFVSQITPKGAFNPPYRYKYGYSAVGTGEGNETVAGLHTITVPSPTGQGASVSTLNYDSSGIFIANVTDANGNVRSYTIVDSTHTQVSIKNSTGATVYTYTSGFDPQMRMITQAVGPYDPNKTPILTIHYSDANQVRPDMTTDGNGKVTQYQWDPYGSPQTVTSPRGTITVYHRDYSVFPLGELTLAQQITAAGVHKTPTKFTYYEPSGLTQTVSSPLPGSADGKTAVVTSFAYDALGNITTITAPGNNAAPAVTTTLNYTTDGAFTQADAMGQPLTVTDNLGHVSHLRYDAQGNPIRQSDALGYTTTFAYNIANQGIETDFPYNPDPAAGPAWRAVRNENYLYPGGPMLTASDYQVAKNGSGTTLYRQVAYGHGAEGEMLSVKGSTEPVTYLYDGAYRLSSLSDGNGHATLYAYNTEGYLKSVTYPNGDTTQYPAYDAIGDVTQRIDGRGITTNYKYVDPENKLTNVQYVDNPQYPNSALLNVSLTYDDYGRRIAMTDGTGSMTYGYDDRDAMTSAVTTYNDPTGAPLPAQTISYGFYPDGSRQSMTTPAGTFNYGYDQAERMNSLTNPYGENFGWTYQDNNWLLTQRLGAAATTTYAYAPGYGWLTGLTTQKQDANKTLLSQFSNLQYDPASNLTGLTANLPAAPQFSGQTTYGYASQTSNVYDSRDQLTQEQSTRAGGYNNLFNYDGAGNPTTFRSADPTAGAGYNSANQNKANLYDGNGNPTTYKGAAFAFDTENRLTVAGSLLTAGYTGDGRRAWKQSASGRTYFLYDGITPVCELDKTGSVIAVNTFGANGLLARHTLGAPKPNFSSFSETHTLTADEIEEFLNSADLQAAPLEASPAPEAPPTVRPLAQSASVFYTFDPQGNTTQRLDPSGNILSSHFFDAFGNSATALADPFGYEAKAGYYTDVETGLVCLTFRYYDPAAGRFLNRDPISYEGGTNVYNYTHNTPTGHNDPFGLCSNDNNNLLYAAAAVAALVAVAIIAPEIVAAAAIIAAEAAEGGAAVEVGLAAEAAVEAEAGLAAGAAVEAEAGLAAEAGETTDLFRAVGVREFNAVMESGQFLPGANSLEARQFAFTLDEALQYASTDASKVAVLQATIDSSALPAFDFSTAIDSTIFRNGVITVQPGAQSDIFHAALVAITHVF